jgi:NAD(P)-dependent dehydrogenase (short-subunit alcohol dehydrogenase family)
MRDLSGRTTVVVGAGRGLGRGIARAFAAAGAPVVAVARTGSALAELATTGANIRTEVADAADETAAWSLLDKHEPAVLILVAGASPVMRPLQHQTWQTFSAAWVWMPPRRSGRPPRVRDQRHLQTPGSR